MTSKSRVSFSEMSQAEGRAFIRSHVDWESVVVHGGIQHVSRTGTAKELTAHNSAVAVLRTIDPTAFSAADAVPHRDLMLQTHIDNVTGRRATAEKASPSL